MCQSRILLGTLQTMNRIPAVVRLLILKKYNLMDSAAFAKWSHDFVVIIFCAVSL